MIRVWDPLVRVFHWTLVLSVGTAWLSAHPWEALHYWAGYAAAALVALRLIWGILGTHYARFSQFVHRPRTTIGYLKAIVTGSEARFVGHNPAGGAMVVALMAVLAATAGTGYALTTDAFWGDTGMQRLHDLVAHLLLLMIMTHIAGVVLASLRHKENLVGAMLSGLKRAPGPEDIS